MYDLKISQRLKQLKPRGMLEVLEDFLWLCYQVDKNLSSHFYR